MGGYDIHRMLRGDPFGTLVKAVRYRRDDVQRYRSAPTSVWTELEQRLAHLPSLNKNTQTMLMKYEQDYLQVERTMFEKLCNRKDVVLWVGRLPSDGDGAIALLKKKGYARLPDMSIDGILLASYQFRNGGAFMRIMRATITTIEVMAKTVSQCVTNTTPVMPGIAYDSEHSVNAVKNLTLEQVETIKGNIEVMPPKERPPWMSAFMRRANSAFKVKQLRSHSVHGGGVGCG